MFLNLICEITNSIYLIDRRDKAGARKKACKKYLVRPIQERLIGTKRYYSTAEAYLTNRKPSPQPAVFLECEEDGRAVSVLRPIANSGQYQVTQNSIKRRSCRVKTLSYSQSQHRRSWSVGGSNVHQTMMRRSESHLRRLEHVAEKTIDQPDSRPSSSSSSCSRTSSDRRNSALVDAETQTISDEVSVVRSGSRRSKGDGLESPVIRREQQTNTALSSESEQEVEEEMEEETYRWERKRGRASGSSQHISLSEASNQTDSQQVFGSGRRYTVDMSQYKYNNVWGKRQPSSAVQTLRQNQYSVHDKGEFLISKLSEYGFYKRRFLIFQQALCQPG